MSLSLLLLLFLLIMMMEAVVVEVVVGKLVPMLIVWNYGVSLMFY